MVTRGIQLPIPSASKVVYQILQKSYTNFPNAFSEYHLPENTKLFAKNYVEHLSQFEIHRATSDDRQSIAQFVLDDMFHNFLFIDGERSVPFASYMEEEAQSMPLSVVNYPWMKDSKGYKLTISHEGKVYNNKQSLLQFAENLIGQRTISSEAITALKSITEYAYAENDGYIDLRGQKFVLLGGTAELTPIYALLQAGAEVLTTHTKNVKNLIDTAGEFCGSLHYATQGMNLLTQPKEIAQTIREFAGEDKIHLVTLAYRGGKGQELRLAVAQDGIIRKLCKQLASICCYVSPSVIAEISPQTAEDALQIYNKPLPTTSKLLRKTTKRRWYGPSIAQKDSRYWAKTICNFQGCSYAASNLFGKYYLAEVYCNDDTKMSANVGGITATSSMDTPLLRAAFREAKRFFIDIFESDETRELMQAMLLYDLLCTKNNDAFFRKQIHGGAFTTPWILSGCVEEAAIRGNLKRFIMPNNPVRFYRKLLRQGVKSQIIRTKSATVFEKIVSGLDGTLAQAFVGGKSNLPAMYLFLGNTSMIPKNAARLQPLLAKMHRLPVMGKWLYDKNRKKKIYGNLLTNMLWPHYKKNDRLVVSTNSNGELTSVRIYKRNLQDVEIFVDENGYIKQTMYFGRSLVDGSNCLSMLYKYNPKKGELRTTGPTSVNTSVVEEDTKISLQPLHLTPEKFSLFERLCKGKPQNSVTFPVNSGFLEECLKLLQNPQWQVDFTRVTVYGVSFYQKSDFVVEEGQTLQATVTPTKIVQTDKGQIFTSQVDISHEGNIINQADISVLVRGNTSELPIEKIPRLEYRDLQGERVDLLTMNDAELVDFALLNGDYNPLHQIDGVAHVVGFKRRINPGLGLLCEIEGKLRDCLEGNIKELTGVIVRPAYPGETYSLEFKEQGGGRYLYQLLQSKTNKVLIDGSFVVG
ncbi:MaoC/PaaZ C-terminal domain-containing protein [Candidatus Uabimicrobium amorphum]|uniref:Uncharacterized protein n=1 Tax=Uabimicrobium amorphum TaxID=2596890 RepID=A0A5S9IHU9_UABAM|nr:MaoC/PaaZ C-terminal domain-containing protein [Candidatus Uabimicrobium amorphum]BBM82063.1 hypothetical protein UABAM_00406 [Candidatus Uabimicrobium amorphum]